MTVRRRHRREEAVERPGELASTLDNLWQHRRWVIGSMIVCAIAAAVVSLGSPASYSSTAEVQVRAVTDDPFDPAGSSSLNQLSMPTEAQLARSGEVARIALSRLNLDETPTEFLADATVVNPVTTTLLRFTYRASDPEEAAQRANAMAAAYLEARQQGIDTSVERISGSVADQISKYSAQRERVAAQISGASGTKSATLVALRQRLDSMLTSLQQRQVALDTLDTRPGVLSGRAPVPDRPAGLSTWLTILIGLFVGLVAGILGANVRGHLDTRVRSLWQVRLPARVSVAVPRFSRKQADTVVTVTDRASAPARTFRSLATRLRLAGVGTSTTSIAVVSPGAQQGVTAVTANLGAALAEQGLRMTLVDACAGAPELDRLFDVPLSPGLNDLGPGEPLDQGLHAPGPAFPGDFEAAHVLVMPAGAADELGLRGNENLLRLLVERSDRTTIIDGGSLDNPDSLAVLDQVDAVVLVVAESATTSDEVARAGKLAEDLGLRVVATVLTPVRSTARRRRPAEAAVVPGATSPGAGGPFASADGTSPDGSVGAATR